MKLIGKYCPRGDRIMMEYEGGYILSYLSDYLKMDSKGEFHHGKLGSNLTPISKKEASKRVMYNFFEENAWNIEGVSVISDYPKTYSEVAMKKFSEQVGIENLEEALIWCQEISYNVLKNKKDFFENMLKENIVEEDFVRMR